MNQKSTRSYVLSFQCPDQLGVVARYSSLLLEAGAFITEISNYSDPVSNTFHLRCVFDDRTMTMAFEAFGARFAALAGDMQMDYHLRPVDQRPRLLLAVSRYDHCL